MGRHKLLTLPSNNLYIFEYHQNLIITEIMSSSLDQLKATGTTVVCDSGDFATIGKYKPQDATTNPSLILAASKKPEYAKLVDNAVAHGKKQSKDIDEQVEHTLDFLLIKLASTWEGIQAAHELQHKHGVNCNLTLMFSLVQAIAVLRPVPTSS